MACVYVCPVLLHVSEINISGKSTTWSKVRSKVERGHWASPFMAFIYRQHRWRAYNRFRL